MTTLLRAARIACALAILFIAAFAFAADPSSPSSNDAKKSNFDLRASSEMPTAAYVAPYMRPIESTPRKSERVVDKKFIGMSVLAMGLTIADIESTQHCMANGSCRELNPMMPKSRVGMYAVNVPLNAGLMYLSYRLKAKGNRAWWVAPLAISGAHAVGAGFVF